VALDKEGGGVASSEEGEEILKDMRLEEGCDRRAAKDAAGHAREGS
jgi:hypothetical protein